MLTVLVAFALLATLTDLAEACNRRRPPPPPPPPPPPGSPPPPPPPPPIVKVVRQREQTMSRNNCKQVQVTAQSDAALASANTEGVQEARMQLENEGFSDQCLNAESFKYECEFSVFSEIALTTIYHPTGCGCAFTIQVIKPRPRLPDVANLMKVNAAYSTKVTRFSIVVYDIVADAVEADIPEFSNMALSPETTAMIEAQVAADPNGDFSSITAGFAGTVKSFTKLPEQLNKNNPANANYVPAIMFTIKQVYTTGAMFKVPCKLQMHTAPNAYVSQCRPFRASAPFDYAKRHSLSAQEVENSNDKAWLREFYLFPKQESTCGAASSGYKPLSRYITSYYNNNNCASSQGYLSFDREFESQFDASDAVVGGWTWTRSFKEARVVFGVPLMFSSLTQTWCLGYSQITWVSPSKFAPTDVPIDNEVCTSLPKADTWANAVQDNKYGEKHRSYEVNSEVKCEPAYNQCANDVTLLGFQNRDPRDFEKRPSSTLLTGPRRSFCTANSQEGQETVVFDTLTFKGVVAGEALAKRNWDDSLHAQPHEIHMVYSDEHEALVHGRHAPHLVHAFNQHRRKRGETAMTVDPVSAPPHRDQFAINNAAGTVDLSGSNGGGAGDHPISTFPETYAAPLTLDPVQSASADEPLVYDGELVTGVPGKVCDDGDLGCTCRPESAASQCDAPFECNHLNYCVRPKCPEGNAGCKAKADNSCSDELMLNEQGFCVYATPCKAGELGCRCDANSACGEGSCLDSLCLKMESECKAGAPGCSCDATRGGACDGGSQCDDLSGLCVFKSCTIGTAGCQCQASGKLCDDGFMCNGDGACVESDCVFGDAGCACLDNKKCNKKGYQCVELNRDGTENACVGYDMCSRDQTERCELECGTGNVAACGKCDYSQPICRDPMVQYCNPKSYLFGVEECDASIGVLSLFAALVALFASL